MSTILLQEEVFRKIREKLPPGQALVDTVAELLFISQDSAYRRIRGETGLVLEEARTLCSHFGLSIDDILGYDQNRVSFHYSRIDNSEQPFVQYLSGIHKNLEAAEAGRAEITYLTKDMPLFYNFLSGPLFAFRYFFWMKSILMHPDFSARKFSLSLLPPEIEALGKSILSIYNRLPSTEIWNVECINSTISQIEYYRDAGYFESESDADAIYSSLAEVIEHIRLQAETGTKFLPGENPSVKKETLQLYHNRVVLGDNTVLVNLNGARTVYLSFDVLNYMVTDDAGFCEGIFRKIENLTRRATILSSANDKQRNIFFNLLLKKIPRTWYQTNESR